MTDTGGADRPLTRRELRARERAAAAAAALGDGPPESLGGEETPPRPPAAPAAAPETEAPGLEEAAPEAAETGAPIETEAPIEAEPVADAAVEPTAVEPEETAAAEAPRAVSLGELGEDAEPAAEPTDQEPAAPKGLGRFFGRKAPEAAGEPQQPVAFDALLEGDADAGEPAAVEREQAVAAADTPEVEAPARARGLKLDESRTQHLDDIRDEDVDRLEIDEVDAVEAQRVSAAEVSGKTPAQLEDTRGESFEADDEQRSGPARGRAARLPFVVNVVEDTSEHHISDLRREGRAGSPSTSTSSITANALVLPASGQEDEIQFESEDGVLVTGSIDLPDGYAASGRARGKFDSADLDSTGDGSEVANPETAPVRASRAVSSYANARVSIAPKRQSRSALPWALGIGGGVVFAGVLVVVIGFTAGWF